MEPHRTVRNGLSNRIVRDPDDLSRPYCTFLVLGAFTIISSFIFRGLRKDDGSTVSHYMLRKEAVE